MVRPKFELECSRKSPSLNFNSKGLFWTRITHDSNGQNDYSQTVPSYISHPFFYAQNFILPKNGVKLEIEK